MYYLYTYYLYFKYITCWWNFLKIVQIHNPFSTFHLIIIRVEFSKLNIEISISVTKASKLRSFEASVGHRFSSFSSSFSFRELSFFDFCTLFTIQKSYQNEETIVEENSEDDEEHNDENGEENEEEMMKML